jgi:hypothetical protein
MPVQDWTRVEAGIFHHFHHGWIEEIARALNGGLLPEEYYAMAEQHAAGFGPDVLTLQGAGEEGGGIAARSSSPPKEGGGLLLAPPKAHIAGETEMEFYRRKQTTVTVRHVSGDRIIAMIEVVSPGNKSTRSAFRSFVEKAAELLNRRVHLMLLDLLPPGKRDPNGIHGAVWDDIAGEEYQLPKDKPLTLAAYESALTVKAYVEHIGVGDVLPDMPLFLEPGAHVPVPLDSTYQRAWHAVPRRWRRVLEAPGP